MHTLPRLAVRTVPSSYRYGHRQNFFLRRILAVCQSVKDKTNQVGNSWAPATTTTMASNPAKRRKLGHSAGLSGSRTKNSALQLALSGGTSRPNTFVLETDELLKEVRLDYKTAFPKADDLLHGLKAAVEGIGPHAATPVSHINFVSCSRLTPVSRLVKLPSDSRVEAE